MSRLRPGEAWEDNVYYSVADTYPLIGKTVIVWDGKFGVLGRLVAVDDHRFATLLPPGGDPVEIRATRIEAVA